MIGKKFMKIQPIYTVVGQIDTDSYRIGYNDYQGTKGAWLLKDQWGNRIIKKDLSKFVEV